MNTPAYGFKARMSALWILRNHAILEIAEFKVFGAVKTGYWIMKRRLIQLNKTIVITFMIGYMAILFLMLLMDWYLIRNYQANGRREEREALQAYIDRTAQAMKDIDHEMYEVYNNNSNFQVLQKETDEVTSFGNAYDLHETLHYRSLVNEDMDGFFIYYNNCETNWYYTKNEKVKQGNGILLNSAIRENLKDGEQVRHWVSIALKDQLYQVIIYKKGRAAVAGVYSMENANTLASGQTRVVLIENGIVYGDQELAKKLGLHKLAGEKKDFFQTAVRNYQICGMRVPSTELWVCTLYPRTIWNMVNIQQILLLLITLVSILAIVAMYGFMKKEIVRPIRQLTGTMDTIKKHESREIPSLETHFLELQEMNQTLEEMVRELEEQKLLVYEEIIEKQKAQMQYLQLQLKPHFYLNGLKTINALAVENETDKIQELILALSKHLRYLLQTEREVVTLEQELDFVKNYVALQNHMTGRPVHIRITADENILGWMVPTLIVHTFVENSVKYAQLGGGITLEIEVMAECLETELGEYLDLIVRDNGQGYSEDILEEINGDSQVGIRSVGINNIKRRCQFLYGEGMEYHFETDQGAISEMVVPGVIIK